MDSGLGLNPIKMTVWKPKDSAALHSFRNRFKDLNEAFEKMGSIYGQINWFSKQDIRMREKLMFLRSLGYIWVRVWDTRNLSIEPTDEAWAGFYLTFQGSEKFYEITQVKPRSVINGYPQFLRIYFKEAPEIAPKEETEGTFHAPVEPPEERYIEIDETEEAF